MMGWGNNGYGYGPGNGVGSEVQRGFDQSAVMNGINNLTCLMVVCMAMIVIP